MKRVKFNVDIQLESESVVDYVQNLGLSDDDLDPMFQLILNNPETDMFDLFTKSIEEKIIPQEILFFFTVIGFSKMIEEVGGQLQAEYMKKDTGLH